MLRALSSGPATPPLRRPAPTKTAEAAGATDRVELAQRPIWQEAERLGLLAAAPAVPGPIGARLSAEARSDLLACARELSQRGVRFEGCSNPNNPRAYGRTPFKPDDYVANLLDETGTSFGHLVATTDSMDMAKVDTLRDLKALEHFLDGRHDELAGRLIGLEKRGLQLVIGENGYNSRLKDELHGGSARLVGAFGAYQALAGLADGPEDLERLWALTPYGTELPVRSAEDLETVDYFFGDRPVARLEADPMARSLRDLDRRGFTFHTVEGRGFDDRLDPPGLWRSSTEHHWPEEVLVGFGEAARLKMKVADLRDPARLDPRLLEVEAVCREQSFEGMHPRAVERALNAMVDPTEGPEVRDRWRFLQDLVEDLKARDPQVDPSAALAQSAVQLQRLLRMKRPAESMAALLEDFKPVRARVGAMAPDALQYFREELPGRCFDKLDYAEDRERLTRICAVSDGFERAVQAFELLSCPVPETFEERLEALGTLTRCNREIPDQRGSDLWTDSPLPFEQAMTDYRLLLRHRYAGQSLAEAARVLCDIHAALTGTMGRDASRQSFAFLERGLARGGFEERTPDQVLTSYLTAAVTSGDLQYARTVARFGEAPSGKIQQEGDRVVIGGIPLPKRRR